MSDSSENQMFFDGAPVDLQNGLAETQVEKAREKYGSNTLTPPPRDPWWTLLLEKFEDPTIRILLVAAVISLLMTVLEKYVLNHPAASFIDSLGIIFAVLLATLAGFFSELKSAREFDLLNKVKDDIRIKVLRGGQITEISIHEIVVGDLVHLDLGDKVPADGVMVDAMGLLVDQSVMTGESVPVEKRPVRGQGELRDKLETLGDEQKVYRGTMVSDGHGMFLVTEVGDRTQLGQIAARLGKEGESENETPLARKLGVLAKQISVVGVCSSMTIFMVMAIATIWKSPLLEPQLQRHGILTGILLAAAALSVLAVRFALRPFFTSMGVKMKHPALRLLVCVPVFIAVLGMGMGFWGLIDDSLLPGDLEFQEGVAMFQSLLMVFVIAVTIIVVAVPEGLPMMVTVSLAMNMMKMARENCLIRKLVASETIGSATVVCSDKTGTLTQNRMTVTWLFADMKEVDGREADALRALAEWPRLVESISANSEAALHIEVDETRDGGREIVEGIGNPTECALLRMLHDAGEDYRQYRDKYPRLWELSHNSQRKMSLVMVAIDGRNVCYAKGAPEKLLDRCTHVMIGGQPEPIGPHMPTIHAALDGATSRALRVIALTESTATCACYTEENAENCMACAGHALVALVGIADPIRAEVPQAVATCRGAGVEVKMITGDAEPTAIAIAKQAGILAADYMPNEDWRGDGDLVLTSATLAKLDDDELLEAIPRLRVLARSTPMDKLRLVKAMHRDGEVVAMTGDGTNDAPALKFADVGISMGITGTEVAKEASDIVLIDDNFKSIVTGIWWGRTLYQNIQRFLQFQLSVNVVALTCALLGPLVGVPLPLTVPQLLWINIIMDTFAAIALSTDPPRANSMKRKPVSRDASIITPPMGVSILLNSFYQVVILFSALYFGWFLPASEKFTFYADPRDLENLHALTVFFTIFVMFQFWHKFNCRSLRYDESPFALLSKNRLFLLIVGMITIVQIVMVQASDYVGIGRIFRTVPLSLTQWLEIALLTVTIIPVAWLVRLLIHQLGLDREA